MPLFDYRIKSRAFPGEDSMEIRKSQAAAMRERAQNLREAACGFSSGVRRTLLDLADAIDDEAARLDAKGSGEG